MLGVAVERNVSSFLFRLELSCRSEEIGERVGREMDQGARRRTWRGGRNMQQIDDMLKILFSALTLCLLAIPPFIRAQEESESAKVRALEVKLMESYKQRQIEAFAAMLDKDFVITTEDGSTYGKTGYVSFTATPSVRIDAVEMSDLKIRIHGNTAVLTGAYHERGENKGIAYDYRDRFTDVWMKSDGRWLLVASHYSIPAKQ